MDVLTSTGQVPPADPRGGAARERTRRVVLAGVAGNVLEWYDFAVYGYFAAAIGVRFFPASDPAASLIAAFGVFAAGFLTRPLWKSILQLVALNALTGAGFYLLFVYSVTYLHQSMDVPTRQAFDINTASMVLLMAVLPAAGALSDRVGRRPVLAAGAGAVALLAWPLFRLMHHHDAGLVLLAQCGFAVALGLHLGVLPSVLAEAFPRRVRCSGFSVAYNLSLAVFGGLSPMVVAYLIARTHDDMAPALVVTAAALLTLASALSLRETGKEPLQ